MKKISFSVSEEQYSEVETIAESEGLTPSQYAKRTVIMSLRTAWKGEKYGYNSSSNNTDTLYDSYTDKGSISAPWMAVPHFGFIADRNQEIFACLSLNAGNIPITCREVTIGLLNQTLVHPREVFSEPLKERCASVIVAHNHPSGRPEPSNADIHSTRRLIKAGKILGIDLLDHIIIAGTEWRSMRDSGDIPCEEWTAKE